MKLVCYFLILFLFLGVAACRRNDEPEEIAGGGTFVPVLSQPQPVTLEQLAAAPQDYLDQYVQVSGRYAPVSKLVCIDGRLRTSPASWSISDGNLLAQVGGFDEQINELLPAGLEVTVNGFWRFWEGLVGCSKQAEIAQVWYLEATTLVSPSPLVRLTLTPSGDIASGGPSISSPVATLSVSSTVEATPTSDFSTPEISPSPGGLPATPTVATPLVTSTPSLLTPTPEFTTTVSITPTGALTVTPTTTPTVPPGADDATSPAPSGSATVTPTPSGSATVTPTPSGSATPTPNADNIIVQGNISSQSLVVDILTAEVGHQYNFDLAAGDVISISLLMVPDDNATFQLLDPDGDVIAQRNEHPAGGTEHLLAYTVSEAGQYGVVIREFNGNPADYAMTLGKATDSFKLVFNEPLQFDQTSSAFIKEDHLHYWHFLGQSGDRVTIIVDPTEDADMAFRVRNPLLQFLDDDYTNNGVGGGTEMASFTLPVSGLYTIDVEEWDFASGNYQITISVE